LENHQLKPVADIFYTEAVLANNHDLGPAKETYSSFVTFFKWGTILAAAVTAIVVLIIASRAA
jgi:hypothetical protein